MSNPAEKHYSIEEASAALNISGLYTKHLVSKNELTMEDGGIPQSEIDSFEERRRLATEDVRRAFASRRTKISQL